MEAQAHETAPPRKLSLFDITERVVAIFEVIDEAEGEVTPEIGAQLDALFADREQKVQIYAALCRRWDAEAAACDEVIAPYSALAQRKRSRVKRLKMQLFDAMQATKTSRIETPTVTAAIQANGGKAALVLATEEPPADAPEAYVRIKREWNRVAIEAALAEGKELDFAKLERGEHLRFR